LRMLGCILVSFQITLREARNRRGKRLDALPPRMARLSDSLNSELCKMRCLESMARSRRRYGKWARVGHTGMERVRARDDGVSAPEFNDTPTPMLTRFASVKLSSMFQIPGLRCTLCIGRPVRRQRYRRRRSWKARCTSVRWVWRSA